MSALESLPPESARSAVASYLQRLPEAPWSPEVARRLLEHVRAAPPRKSAQRRTAWVRLALAACLVLVLLQPDLRPYSGYTTPPQRNARAIRCEFACKRSIASCRWRCNAAKVRRNWLGYGRSATRSQHNCRHPRRPVRYVSEEIR